MKDSVENFNYLNISVFDTPLRILFFYLFTYLINQAFCKNSLASIIIIRTSPHNKYIVLNAKQIHSSHANWSPEEGEPCFHRVFEYDNNYIERHLNIGLTWIRRNIKLTSILKRIKNITFGDFLNYYSWCNIFIICKRINVLNRMKHVMVDPGDREAFLV